jgi:hypothetical protein
VTPSQALRAYHAGTDQGHSTMDWPHLLPLIAADAVLTCHLAFILFVAFGALLALKWRWVPWLQLPAAAWGFYVELSGRICPLTYVENHFRAAAGQGGYSGDFIGHYLLATIYPAALTRTGAGCQRRGVCVADLPARAAQVCAMSRRGFTACTSRKLGSPPGLVSRIVMVISGRCHCGNIAFTLDWKTDPAQIPARACTCTFCTKHGGTWTSCPTGSLKVTVQKPEQVSRYAFGTSTADFHICTCCGVVPVVTSLIDGNLYAVVNVNTFENVDATLLSRSSSTLDEETGAERLDRRKRNWIADVAYVTAA